MFEKIYYKQFDEFVYHKKLHCGLDVHVLKVDSFKFSSYVQLFIPYGSNDTYYTHLDKTYVQPAGIAHFLEHMIFAMPDGSDAFEKFDEYEADANAMTTRHYTKYVFNTTKDLIKPLNHLLNMLDTPYFTDENVKKEEKIIEKELIMYMDELEDKLYNKLLENMYHKHPIKEDIGGTVQSIKAIKKENLYEVYNAFYQNSNRHLIIGGAVDLEKLNEFLTQYDLKHTFSEVGKVLYEPEDLSVIKTYDEYIEDVQTTQIMIGYKLPPLNEDELKIEKYYTLPYHIMLEIAFGKTSSFYQSLMNDGIVTYLNASHRSYNGARIVEFTVHTSNKNAFLKRFDDYVQGLEQDVNIEDFAMIKNSYLGVYLKNATKISNKIGTYGSMLIRNFDAYQYADLLKEIKFDDIYEHAKNLRNYNRSVVVFKKAKR